MRFVLGVNSIAGFFFFFFDDVTNVEEADDAEILELKLAVSSSFEGS